MTYKETLFFVAKCLTINHEEHNKILVENDLKKAKIDWDAVVKVSTGHYVFPALYCNLKRAEFLHYLPEDLVNYMKHITDLNRDRNEQIIAQAKEINQLLLDNNITPIFLKGTGNILENLYEDIAERMVGDIDFLVSEKEFEKSVNLLMKNNYEKTSDKLSSPIFQKHYPRIFNKNKISAVEVHIEMLKMPASKIFNYKSVHESLIIKNNYTLLNFKDQLVLSTLALQYNDNGYMYKTISLRNTYDIYLLSFKTDSFNSIQNYKTLFKYLNPYLYVSKNFLNSENISYKQTKKSDKYLKILLLKIKHPFFSKLHTNFVNAFLYIYAKLKGTVRFIKNKKFRTYYVKKLTS